MCSDIVQSYFIPIRVVYCVHHPSACDDSDLRDGVITQSRILRPCTLLSHAVFHNSYTAFFIITRLLSQFPCEQNCVNLPRSIFFPVVTSLRESKRRNLIIVFRTKPFINTDTSSNFSEFSGFSFSPFFFFSREQRTLFDMRSVVRGIYRERDICSLVCRIS